jgi:predicted signal transduction protein with EAL and GGDEF domain
MLEAFRLNPFTLPGGEPLQVTCSVGYCPFPVLLDRPQAITWTQAVEIADMCLYQVKRNGRDGWAGPVVPEGADVEALAQRLPGGLPALVEEGALALRGSFQDQRLLALT